MARCTYVYTADGRSFLKGSPEHEAYLGEKAGDGAFIAPDEGDFVSPIDGKVYSGRAGMREHCRRHDVVNNRDLAGLPYRNFGQGVAPDSKQLRANIIEAARRGGYLEGQ